ncbi:putative cytochrome p450 [Lyophyllum shimeji]|uniref:Cytochrome p450 n=1 Tax=Lyophyllum shimeji TaxID=47721 RepID=A0A9P3PJ18_LYOSH|nr:putative cytochrome p450 [Lyophyllum shimeji]
MSAMWLTLILVGLLTLLIRRLAPTDRSYSHLPLPPGPKASWLGKVSLPQTYPWRTYAQWKQIYGDIIYISVFRNPILVLNSARAAADLLEKRSSNYSSRPTRTMIVELIGWDWLFSSMVYGSWWKRHRNMFHIYFRPNDSSDHHPLQIKETHTLLRNLLDHPDEFRYYCRRVAAAIILNVTYGHQVAEGGDDYVALADRALSSLAQAGIFGTYLVDYIPILKYVPAWFPFASFKRKAFKWRASVREMVNKPFDMVKEAMGKGTATSCVVAQELEKRAAGFDFEEEDVIKNVAATTYAAGSDTFVSAVLSFFLVAALYPEIQAKAQQELDAVAVDRLPDFNDRSQLPFIESLCYELLRWNPVTPLGIAHYASEDDEYEGYRIPKGTTVLPNVWAILHDPAVYPDPMAFNPSRFLDRKHNDSMGINPLPEPAFGFGRRMCPGRWFAFDAMWIVVASILSVYEISKAVDENGQTIEPKVEYESHLLSHPKPFKCRIVPRSHQTRSLIQQTDMLE